jgi:hypothetical protein
MQDSCLISDILSKKDSSLVSQCLAFCQTLASHGRAVNFSLKIGSSFVFSLDTKDNEKVPASKAKKKVSPSTQRRNQRRQKEFLASKEALSPLKTSLNREIHDGEAVLESKVADSNEVEKPSVSCDLCGHRTKTQNGMKLHKKNKHEILQIDGNNSINEEQKEED